MKPLIDPAAVTGPGPQIWASGLIVLLACAFAVTLHDGGRERGERYGGLLAESLAELAVGPLLLQDRIELGLLSNRGATLPGVAGVTIYGVDSKILAMTDPAPRGSTYVRPIELDGSVVGYLNLTLQEDFLNPNRWPLWLLIACLIAGLPWVLPPASRLVAEALVLLQSAGPAAAVAPGSADRAAASRTGRGTDRGTAGGFGHAAEAGSGDGASNDLHQPIAPKPAYLLLANLLNQLSLTTAERQALVADAIALGRDVIELYGGELQPLTGASLAVWFPDDDSDSGFRAACAALVLTRLLRSASDTGVFRLALHYAADRSAAMEPAYLSDTALLAAAAANGEVMLSHAVTTRLRHPERLHATAIEHPLGADFATTSATCQRLRSVVEPFESMLERQCNALLGQRDSTAS